ncbi:ATP-dependent RNA helicase RhlB [Gammaproteobacteria bacterium]|nr:MAG: DEAD/DEAH box helicase [Gammaproteobacteria bacterium]CAG0942841.1 ATP-dependent RNA helicase RhlB [Gammaproteobacteria bacterium]
MNGPRNLLFSELGLPEPILEGIRRAGFQACTPIQSQTLPLALGGQDIAGQAQTGTGKTAAFLIATFNRLLRHAPPGADRLDGPRAVILAPTRELAVQIHADALVLGAATGLRIAVVFGGTDYDKQRDQLAAGVDVLIGTPGRLIDFFKQHIFSLRHVQVMVLDEADRMFDLGFIKDIRFVLRRLPPFDRRLNLLFSATLSYRVLELAYEHMNNPHLVQIEPDKKTVDKVTQVVYFPANHEKPGLLISIMKRMQASRTMVFVNTKREADHVADILNANAIGAAAISGDVPQPKRLKMLKNFQEGSLPVLVATDVASRGLHVPDVSHVVNYDLPQDPEDYVHRIGRTARAGASGDSVSFACESYAVTLPEIEAYIGHRIPVGQIDPGLLVEVKIPPREARPRFPGRGGARGRPGSGGGSGGGRGRSGGSRSRHRPGRG